MTTAELLDIYKQETGEVEVNVPDFEFWLFMRDL